MFHPASWLALYAGFDLFPEATDPVVDAFDAADLDRSLREMREAVTQAVARAPDHADFLARLDPTLAA